MPLVSNYNFKSFFFLRKKFMYTKNNDVIRLFVKIIIETYVQLGTVKNKNNIVFAYRCMDVSMSSLRISHFGAIKDSIFRLYVCHLAARNAPSKPK